jgi:hypothetical protein
MFRCSGLAGNVIADLEGEQVERGLHQFDRKPLAGATMTVRVVTAALWDEVERIGRSCNRFAQHQARFEYIGAERFASRRDEIVRWTQQIERAVQATVAGQVIHERLNRP